MNKFLATAVLSAVCLTAAPAAAVTTLSWTSGQTGLAYVVNFNGIVEGNLVAGLTGQVTYTLQSVVGNSWTFGYSVDNTSSAPITASRISIFGFNVTPDITSTSSTGLFNLTASGNVPGQPFDAEACYKGAGGANCSGGGSAGVEINDAAAVGTFTLNFGAPPANGVTLADLFIRYQSIAGTAFGDSGTGVPTDGGPPPVPEPATWAMMIVGFGMAGTMIRLSRRRHYLAV